MNDRAIKLLAIYAKLPTIECKGLCHASCGPIHASLIEIERMQQQMPLNPKYIKDPGVIHKNTPGTTKLIIDQKTHVCPYLSPNNRCQVYEQRPLICRTYGTAEGLQCPHGCTPTRLISKEEFLELVEDIDRIHQDGVGSEREQDHPLATIRSEAVQPRGRPRRPR